MTDVCFRLFSPCRQRGILGPSPAKKAGRSAVPEALLLGKWFSMCIREMVGCCWPRLPGERVLIKLSQTSPRCEAILVSFRLFWLTLSGQNNGDKCSFGWNLRDAME